MFNSLVIDYMTKVIHWKSDMTHSDVHGRIDKKKKHWEICIETSRCFSDSPKGQKDTYDCYLFILV